MFIVVLQVVTIPDNLWMLLGQKILNVYFLVNIYNFLKWKIHY